MGSNELLFLGGILTALIATAWGLTQLFSLAEPPMGSTPHCRKCGYNLTGNTSGCCPECGLILTGPDAATYTLRNHRRRCRRRLGLSLLLLVAGVLMATVGPSIRKFNWYRIQPTTWIIGSVDAPNLNTAHQARRALSRRYAAGRVSNAEMDRVLEKLITYYIDVPPTMIAGHDYDIKINGHPCGMVAQNANALLVPHLRFREIRFNGQAVQRHSPSVEMWYVAETRITPATTGSGTLEIELEVGWGLEPLDLDEGYFEPNIISSFDKQLQVPITVTSE